MPEGHRKPSVFSLFSLVLSFGFFDSIKKQKKVHKKVQNILNKGLIINIM